MNEIEAIVGIGPVRIAVLKFKLYVRGYPGRLNRRNISSNDLGIGKFVGEITKIEMRY